jgi:hypothetical protein
MKKLGFCVFIIVSLLLLLNCISNKNMENCKIKTVLRVSQDSENSYFMHVKFNTCKAEGERIALIKNELKARFPFVENKTIKVKEYLGKMYNEYKYDIQVE